MSKTCLVLGKTGVGKSSFINGISEGKVPFLAKDSKNAATIESQEIQKAASEYPDFVYIILLLNFQEDRIDKSIIKILETYMKTIE